jgi:CBS domain containing-hemolysin-like protein
MDAYLSATQFGITISSLALGAVGEELISKGIEGVFSTYQIPVNPLTVHSIALPLALAVLTFVHVIFGEQIPKMIGIKYALAVSLWTSVPLRFFYVCFSPFIWTLNKSTRLFLRIMGIKSIGDSAHHTEEELRLLLTESEEGGAIKPSENELIQNVFDFDDRFVRQIMVPENRMSALNIESGKTELVKRVLEEGFSRWPVYLGDKNHIIGFIHSKDLLKHVVENRFTSVKDFLLPVHFVPETMRINELLKELQKHHIHMAVVTNEFGTTAGLVTMEDIIEELVGEIQDEHDDEKPPITKINESEFIVHCQTSISDANALLPHPLPENNQYETVSGYVNFIFHRIPALNEKIEQNGYVITVTKRNPQHVETVHLKVNNT